MTPITACILTKNEEKNLPGCIETLSFADEIHVVDSGSTDGTVEIAKKAGARVFHRPWTGFYDQRMYQFSLPETEWLLWLDADERCSSELQKEIVAWKSPASGNAPPGNNRYNGYNIPRLTHFMGSPIRHCGWFPDRMPRLFKKDSWKFNREGIHAKIMISGGEGRLQHVIHHHPYPDLATYYKKMGQYAVETADYKFKQGRRSSLAGALAIGPARFLKTYFLQRGFLDGRAGLAVSWLAAMSDSMKYLELYRRSRNL